MGRFAALLVAALGGLTLAGSVGCTTKVRLSEETGIGGQTGGTAGGARGGTGGVRPGIGGSLDAGPFGTDGPTMTCLGQPDASVPRDGSTTDAQQAGDAGVCSMLPADPSTFPWTISPKLPGTAPDAGASGCQTNVVANQVMDVVCSGAATLSSHGVAADGGAPLPTIVWGDGSRLTWQPTNDNMIPPPIAQNAADRQVWVELESHGWLSVPGQCGWVWDQSMDVRNSAGGPIVFMAREGASLPELTADQSMALFGTTSEPVPKCRHDMLGGPGLFHQTLYDHVLGTASPARVPYSQQIQVATPNGNFDVIWYSRTQQAQALSTTCAGCLNQGPIVGLLAAWISP